ncbi:nucleotidyl transferase AbiEii/AbiGii toxin family protein [Tistrella mobilis]
MDDVARLPARDRAALFGEAGAGRGVANTIIEKDFWVCWSLRRLFGLPKGTTATLVFKGGTSLSKAFNAIRRFSEDIDAAIPGPPKRRSSVPTPPTTIRTSSPIPTPA